MENLQNKINSKNSLLYSAMVIFILAVIFLTGYFLFSLGPVSKLSNVKELEIKNGEGFRQISLDLKSAGLIKSRVAFEVLSLLSGSAHKLKPGTYSLDSNNSTINILKTLVAGPDLEKEVVIPEGLTFLDIDKKLSDAGVLPAGALAGFNFEKISAEGGSAFGGKNNYEFLKPLKSPIKLEGYLFPDTYKFFLKSTPEDVLKKFLDNFSKKAIPLFLTNNSSSLREISQSEITLSINNILTIASLVEKEVYFDNQRAEVAGIIYKRLKMGMALQIDATITYAKCKGLVLTCINPAIIRAEINLNSPYNTYLHAGLPPTPISNPGLASIIAALHPKPTENLYYLSDPKTHEIIFSKTLDEQINNRAKYLGL